MDPEEIRLELFKRRKTVTAASIAREIGVSHQAVHGVIDRQFVSCRIMEAVANAIGKNKRYVFPEYFMKKAAADA